MLSDNKIYIFTTVKKYQMPLGFFMYS